MMISHKPWAGRVLGGLSIMLFLALIVFSPSILDAAKKTSIKKTNAKTTIKDIKYQSFKGYTRVIVYLSGPAEFVMNHLSNPERLYFDLKDTALAKNVRASFNIGDGVIKSVRSRQFSKDAVRIVFDLEKAEDYKTSLLNKKGARLVIDVYTPKAKKKEPDAAELPLTKKPEAPPLVVKETPKAVIQETPKTETPPQPQPKTPDAPLSKPSELKEPDAKKEETTDLVSSGLKHEETGEHERALTNFKKAAEQNPKDAEIYVHIGRSLFRLGKKEEAIEAYKKAIEIDPDSAEAYNGLGYSYYVLGDPGSAIDAFLMAIKLNPDHDDAHAGLGYTYLTIGKTSAAMEQYRILKGLESNKADELFSLIFKTRPKEKGKTLK